MNSQMHPPISKYKAEEREIWTAEMLMQAIDACENKWLKVAFHLAFAATVRIGEASWTNLGLCRCIGGGHC